MRLVRVQIPEFRALKNVDITFEPDFYPQVFPLGSLNGGGKSTLLQLIFVLLNIEPSLSSASYLTDSHFKNLLLDLIDKSIKAEELRSLATITLSHKDKELTLYYFYGDFDSTTSGYHQTYLREIQEGNFYPYFSYKENDKTRFKVLADNESNTQQLDHEAFHTLLSDIKKYIFLISPSNQSYIFATQEERRLPYMSDGEKNHNQTLKRLKDSFPNFFTYDFIDVLTEIFRLARDKDYNERLKTGVYGTHSEQLEKSINNLFIDGKKITPLTIDQKRHTKDSIQSMGFKLPSGEEIYPEDLSHGELKRLTIFILFQYYEIQDAIILMDEIENAFHPDWQRHIVDDLLAWGPSNQYILATHSYELCRGVTPAHVKEIYPKLPFEPEQQL
ncbi:AAA family ATPase [Methylovulum psychrotolerans]|uniref:ATP-binding protein n=1 Tax=Methylovulum psychrotolerans TaxID=1704499 RepID=A0A1Z4BUD8_9GAMM|nr:AAA family ATPase [Methylovulum psychrotolerans]ASF44917.1 ATP-binding protein [Methylovulum psychrotolerans]